MLTTLSVHGVRHLSVIASVRRTNIVPATFCSALINVEALWPLRAQAQNSAPSIQRHAQDTANYGDRTSQQTSPHTLTAQPIALVSITLLVYILILLSIPLCYQNMNICGIQSNTTLKDVNIQKATRFGLKLAILRPYKEHFRQNIDDAFARTASLLLQLCSTNGMLLIRDVKHKMLNCL
jgi:hypothetical protein